MILRDVGSNGDREMAHAFHVAGFQPVDATMNDLIAGHLDLAEFRALVFVGGFTFADSLGAGRGWALTIQEDPRLKLMFDSFRDRNDTFSLGICNGCQLMAELGWVGKGVKFVENKSGRFESRFSSVKISPEWANKTVMLQNMGDSVLGIWVAHGEGRYVNDLTCDGGELLHYTNASGDVVDECDYPLNPNGGLRSVAGVCSANGRHLAMMPHPERCVMKYQVPWISDELKNTDDTYYPWIQMFINARKWIDQL
jgi:phosphoribosylformylglycinamidine synthase